MKKLILFAAFSVITNRKGVEQIQKTRLLSRAQQGDAEALDALVRAYYPEILHYCRWHLPDAQLAQDAAQETFLRAVRWLDACGGFSGQFRPFLYKIAQNLCVDYCRSAQKDGPPLETLPEEPAYQEAGFAQTEEELSLRAMTARLEPEQRELVLLRFAQQLKLREIAQVTGLPMRTVQSRLRAALKTLKQQLEQEGFS